MKGNKEIMSLIELSNICVVIFGVTAIWLSQDKNPLYRKYSSIFGLLSQPFWFYIAIAMQQFGVFIVCVLYCIAWIKGFYNNWIRGEV